MPTIIALNPRRKSKKKKKRKKRKMSALQLKYFGKGRKRRALTAKQKKYFGKGRKNPQGATEMAKKRKTTKKRRKNPSPRKAAKRVYRYTKQTIGGVNMMRQVFSIEEALDLARGMVLTHNPKILVIPEGPYLMPYV